MRAAIYFTPPAEAPLTRLAAQWLGRDPYTDRAERVPEAAHDELTAEPARYGFHATMKAPFRLAEGCDLATLDGRLSEWCAARAAVTIGALSLARIGAFFALVPAQREPDLHALADAVVAGFDTFRAPLDDAEFARRRPERLSERQRAHLLRWGYPYVFDEFRFHMTLTGPVPDERAGVVEDQLTERFGAILGRPAFLDGLALFVEDRPGLPFCVHSRHPFGRG